MAKKKLIPQSSPLAEAIRTLLSIEGVEGIGQAVTVISPADLPLDFLGFIERLRAGPVELDDEMLLITLATTRRRRTGNPVERLREALLLLCRYATDNGVAAGDVLALLDETKCRVSQPPIS